MHLTRVMIIALDGLESSLVTSTMLNLLQTENGIVDVNVYPLMTPLIWATFLTGTIDNGVKITKYSSSLGDKLSRITYSLGERLSRIVGYERSMKIMSSLGGTVERIYTPFQYTKDDLTQPTIFDLVDAPVALDIPAYNENPIYMKIRSNTALAINHQYSEEEVVSEIWALFQKEYDDCLRMLLQDWDLFMVHFCVTDIIGHLFWDRSKHISACYHIMNDKVGELTRRARDAVVLIISDHGIQRGIHTHKGFYSVNTQLNLTSPKMTDFYDIVEKEWLGGRNVDRTAVPRPHRIENKANDAPQQDKEKVLKHLKELGYF